MTSKQTKAESNPVARLASEALKIVVSRPEDPSKTEKVLAKLQGMALDIAGYDVERMLATLRAQRVSDREIIETLVPAAARHFGQCWEDDSLSFSEVTMATSRLESLLQAMSSEWDLGSHHDYDATRPSILMVVPENEQHVLGALTAMHRLRRWGYSVRLGLGWSVPQIRRALMLGGHELLMFSCPRGETLEQIANAITQLRRGNVSLPPTLMGGAILTITKNPLEAAAKAGVDEATNDLHAIERMLRSPGQERNEAAE